MNHSEPGSQQWDLIKVLKVRDTVHLTKVVPPASVECRQGNIYQSVAHGFQDEFSESQLCAYYLLNYYACPTY